LELPGAAVQAVVHLLHCHALPHAVEVRMGALQILEFY
jgi:hypothetical protein